MRNECLLTGPCRAILNHGSKDIRIETTADHPAGEGLVVCRLPMGRKADAVAIAALSDLLSSAVPFAQLGRLYAGQDPAASLIAVEGLNITVGDAQRVAAALDRARPPDDGKRPSGRGKGPRPVIGGW
jgi:hypothetical protein